MFDVKKHHRQSIRIPWLDYTQPGAYYVTICTHERHHMFGEIVGGEMVLNEYGRVAWDEWERTGNRSNVELDAFVVMPNHVHGIVWIRNVGAWRAMPLRCAMPLRTTKRAFAQPVAQSLPTIVGAFKSAVTKRINERRRTPGMPVWQRNYYEHMVRNERDLDRIRNYIQNNPINWHWDRNRC